MTLPFLIWCAAWAIAAPVLIYLTHHNKLR